MAKQTSGKINIRPGVSILSVLRHLNYRPWYAIAEFVDNSLQSCMSNRKSLQKVEGKDFRLSVDIELDTTDAGRIVVRDNAAGIAAQDYQRAFRPAEVPPDQSGLCEFGMGMKSSACWLARHWTARTTALGEKVERTVSFDVDKIVINQIEELDVHTRHCDADLHYTEIVLEGLHNMPQGRTIGKIKEHLASIYRMFLREGVLQLSFGSPSDMAILEYQEPSVLCAPFYKTSRASPVSWRKEIDFDFGQGQRAWGFAALRERASTSTAGFALFRRKRLIQGSGDEPYRPEVIFGKSNSYRYQRLFGELNLQGFEISHTKDGFRWEEHEEVFLQLLREHLDAKPLPLLLQAEEHRVRPPKSAIKVGAQAATERTAQVIERDVPEVLVREIEAGPEPGDPPTVLPTVESMATSRVIDVDLRGQPWRITLELSTDPSVGDWVSVSDLPPLSTAKSKATTRCIAVRLSLAHPFMDRFGGTEAEQIEPLLRLAAAIGLAETAARDAGVKMAGTIRRNINDLLRDALSNP